MNCDNCGATMRYVDGRGYFTCDYCATRRDHHSSLEGDDRVAFSTTPVATSCPTCRERLHEAALDGYRVEACNACGGILTNHGVFGKVIKIRRAASADGRRTPAPIDPREFERSIACPSCRRRMEVHPYYGPGAVVIDTCAGCGLVWLDRGELRAIELAPGS